MLKSKNIQKLDKMKVKMAKNEFDYWFIIKNIIISALHFVFIKFDIDRI